MLAFGSLHHDKAELTRVLYMFAVFSLVLGLVSILAFTGRHPLGFTLSARAAPEGDRQSELLRRDPGDRAPDHPGAGGERDGNAGAWASWWSRLVNIGSIVSTRLARRDAVARRRRAPALAPAGADAVQDASQKVEAVALICRRRRRCLLLPLLGRRRAASPVDLQAEARQHRRPARDGSRSGRRRGTSSRSIRVTGIGYGAFVRTSRSTGCSTRGFAGLRLFKTEPKEVHNAYLGQPHRARSPRAHPASSACWPRRCSALGAPPGARSESASTTSANVANALMLVPDGWGVGSIFVERETSRPRWIVIGSASLCRSSFRAHVTPHLRRRCASNRVQRRRRS